MSDNIYKSIEIVGSSQSDVTDAINNAVTKASETVRNIDWIEVTQIRGHVVDGKVDHFQVAMKLGFRLD